MTKSTPKGWTEADYEAAGMTRVNLRLRKDVAQILSDEADRLGTSRQAIVEGLVTTLIRQDVVKEIFRQARTDGLLDNVPKPTLEQPLHKPSDYRDAPKKKRTKKQ